MTGYGGDNVMADPVKRITDAILVSGTSPNYHQEQLRRLRQNWPTLTWALVALLEQQHAPIPNEWRSR